MDTHSKVADVVLNERIASVVFRLSTLDTDIAAGAVLGRGVMRYPIPLATDQPINQTGMGKDVSLGRELVAENKPRRTPSS